MKNTVAISCWFGEEFTKPNNASFLTNAKTTIKYIIKSNIPSRFYSWAGIYSVIPNRPLGKVRCIFFTNNKSLKKEILLKGWEYILIVKGINKEESISSSLQAKEVKFLQLNTTILKDLLDYKYIVYMDSRTITDEISKLTTLCEKGILIQYTLRLKNSVWDEVKVAEGQERYAKNMAKTIRFIEEKINGPYTHNNRVMATGIIVYKVDDSTIRNSILKLCKEVYDACMELEQPECQILWCILSQKYDDIITKIDYDIISTRSI